MTIWKADPHQRKGVSWILKHPFAGLFLDPGLGKTSIVLEALRKLKQPALIVSPKQACYHVWSDEGEVGKWDRFNHMRVALLHGAKKEKRLLYDADLFVINPDGLRWLVESGGLSYLLRRGVKTLVIDELSKFKNATTKRAKILKPYLSQFERRWGLTGTPAANGLIDLFGQMFVLDLGASLGRHVSHYRFKYFYPSGYKGYVWELKDGAEKAIHKALKPTVISMRASDHLKLPKLVERDIWVTLPPKARKIYDGLEEDLVAQVESGTVVAANAAVASGKCRQVASGGVYYGDVERVTEKIHDAKTDALVDLVGELQGSPILVAYDFNHDVERIRGALGKVPRIGGGTSMKESSKLIKQWNAGELPVLCAHPASVGHGLNLQQSGNHICWYTLTWNLELYIQFNDRVWRKGQKASRVVVHRLLARDTVDDAVSLSLKRKTRRQSALMDALKRNWRKRGVLK